MTSSVTIMPPEPEAGTAKDRSIDQASFSELSAFAAKNKAKVKALKHELEMMRQRAAVTVEHQPVVVDERVAEPATPRNRHRLVGLSFVLMVVVPSLAASVYLFGFAADQYASRVAFSIRSAESAAPAQLLGALTKTLGGSIGPDAEIVNDFIRSQGMVESAMAALPLEKIYNRPEDDFVFRLGENEPIETVTAYWNRMTNVSFDPTTGIVDFEARAFDPESAREIAAFVLERSARLVNELSQAARDDAVKVSAKVLAEAETRLREVRKQIAAYRDANQQIDPTEDAKGALTLVAGLEAELAQAQVALDEQIKLVGERSPRLPTMRQRIASLEARIAEERAKLGAGADGDPNRATISDSVAEYEELSVEQEFAQNAYVSALTAYETAQIETRRQMRYLAPHIEPTLSVKAQYPKRWLIAPMIFFVLTVGWAVLLLIAYNVRDRQ